MARDADARARRQLPPALRRLGGRGPLLVPPDRVLIPERGRGAGRQEGLHRRTASATSASSSRSSSSRAASAPSTSARSSRSPPPTAPVRTGTYRRSRSCCSSARLRQERADPALRVAARRDGGPDARLRADPRGDDGHGGRVHRRAQPTSCMPPLPRAMALVAIVGRPTALFAATIGAARTTSRRCSPTRPISQLGYMFLACGVGAFAAGIFHVLTHAFFKALLFLGAGRVIHAPRAASRTPAQDGRPAKGACPSHSGRSSGRARDRRESRSSAGFFSKDEILGAASSRRAPCCGPWAPLAAVHHRVLHVPPSLPDVLRRVPRGPRTGHHIHESPAAMTVPLAVLAVLSTVGGHLGCRIPGRARPFPPIPRGRLPITEGEPTELTRGVGNRAHRRLRRNRSRGPASREALLSGRLPRSSPAGSRGGSPVSRTSCAGSSRSTSCTSAFSTIPSGRFPAASGRSSTCS